MIKYADKLPYGLELLSDSIVRKTARCGSIETLNITRRLINHFIDHPDPMVVPVFEWKEDPIPKSGLFTYSYAMKRMGLLSETERHITHHCCNLFKDRHSIYREVMRQNARNYLAPYMESHSELISFLEKAIIERQYWDAHNGNFMKDEFENYKIIDVEGFLTYRFDESDYPIIPWLKD